MNLYYPWHLLLLLVIVPLAVLLLLLRRRREKRFSQYAEAHFAPHYLARLSPFYTVLKISLLILALIFLILALVRPQWDYEHREFESEGLDIIICLDISKSMDAVDMSPSRLIRAKLQIASFLEKLEGDRVGLIAFAGRATLECPLTDDYESVSMVLKSLTTASAVQLGTDIGAALELAEQAFNAAGGSNILILISDGEDLENSGVQQAARLATTGKKIYTMGVGTAEGSVVIDPETGEEAFSRLDVNTLQRIASAGGGKFYAVTPGQSELELILQNIYTAEKGRQRSKSISSLREQYHIFAVFALLILLLESLILPLRKPREQT